MTPLLLWLFLLLLVLWVGFVLGSASQAHRTVELAEPPAPLPDELDAMQDKVAAVLAVGGWRFEHGVVSFDGQLLTDPDDAQHQLADAFAEGDLTPMLQEAEGDRVRVTLVPGFTKTGETDRPRWWLHGLLLGLTLITTTWAGAWHAGVNPSEKPFSFFAGLPYSLGLLLILGAHELGHYFTARKNGLRVTPPYFIPVPFALGTFGAFIKMKSLSPSRRALFDVAVAGPLAGLVFAIPALIIGLQLSEPIPADAAPMSWIHGGGVNAGSSLLMALLSKLALGDALLESHQIALHPLAFAGWLGLLVTALNLLPIGQLDGGHMAHALFGPTRAHNISVASLVGLFLLAFFVWPGLMMWAILVYLIAGTRDVPPANDITPVGLPRRVLGYFTFALLLAILLPVPHELYQTFGLHCPYL